MREGGVGIGWRPEIAADLLARPSSVDHVEVVAESATTSEARRELAALAEIWPVFLHGVKLSLGSAEGVERERARRLGALARELRAPCITEHVSFVRAGGHEIGHLTAIPYTKEAVAVVARNVAVARRELPDVPLLLENIAWSFRYTEDELDEGEFFHEIVRATGCELLLDVGNLHANAKNAGVDPFAVLERFPLEHVGMLHVAGGIEEHGFYFDTHAHAVPDEVFELAARVLERRPVPVIIERDANFPAFAELEREIDRLRAPLPTSPRFAGGGATPAKLLPPPRSGVGLGRGPEELARQQKALARLLTTDEPASDLLDARSLHRARSVLRRKRIDDAMPLLPALAARSERVERLAIQCLAHAPRPRTHVAVADALRIAERAAREPDLEEAARVDRQILRARFTGPDDAGAVQPRATPYFARERFARGSRWVFKGLGASAPVRVLEMGDRS